MCVLILSMRAHRRYFSPYPLIETEDDAPTPSASTSGAVDSTSTTSASTPARIAGVARATIRSHGRTSDLLAGGLGREHSGPGERSTLWVCDRCFKYMADGTSWEAHIVRVEFLIPSIFRISFLFFMFLFSSSSCTPDFLSALFFFYYVLGLGNGQLTGARCAETVPTEASARKEGVPARCPHDLGGRRREGEGAQIFSLPRSCRLIGPAYQLYCQNLSLFGKLFIDIKTLFFDCDNCVLRFRFLPRSAGG